MTAQLGELMRSVSLSVMLPFKPSSQVSRLFQLLSQIFCLFLKMVNAGYFLSLCAVMYFTVLTATCAILQTQNVTLIRLRLRNVYCPRCFITDCL